jgi:hypothetical protein
MWRPLLFLLWCWAALAWANAGPFLPEWEEEEAEPGWGGFPAWLVALERIFRRGVGRLLGWGMRKTLGFPHWLWGMGLVRSASWLLSALIGPCGRLWRWCLY